MAIAGRVAIVPKGDYDKNASYKRLDCVKYLNVMYVAKKDVPIGTAITDESYWMKGVEGGGGGGSSVIDDTQSSTLTTYSSNKINEFISDVGNSISNINASLGDKINTTGDVSEAVVSTLDEIPNTRLIPSVGDKIKVMFAKTIKYFQDLKTIAFTGDYEDLLNKPSIPTVTNNLLATESGTALDAVQGKAINDKIGSTDISAIGNGTVTGALSTLNSKTGMIPTLDPSENIDNLLPGETICVATPNNSGTKPINLRGNKYILLSMSFNIYGVQLAISFGSTGIAIRNKSYGKTEWSEWRYI